ncbi:MAG: hypothetical protein ACXVBW_13855 [Bdellovibrionota bacterium]
MEQHADEEEKEIFKEARKLGDDRLEQLGQQIQERKKDFNQRDRPTESSRAERRKGMASRLMPSKRLMAWPQR